jgi:hypothetical protein
MTRDAAQRAAHSRNSQLKLATDRWFPRRVCAGVDGWALVKVGGLPASLSGAMKTTTEAKPRPPMADDPRPAHWQNVGGPWVPWGL